MYRPPDSSKYLGKDFVSHLNGMLSKLLENSKEIILMGDFNVAFLKQENKELKALLDVFLFKQMVKNPTRISEASATFIDIILTNNPAKMVEIDVIPTSIRDHDM